MAITTDSFRNCSYPKNVYIFGFVFVVFLSIISTLQSVMKFKF